MIEWIESIRGIVSIKQACEWLNLPRSKYYRLKKSACNGSHRDLEKRIYDLCNAHKFRYGYRKITAILRLEMRVNHKRVQSLMQREGLQCRVKVKKRKVTGQPAQVAEHLLKRDFSAKQPMHKLVTDITYLSFAPKVLYLSSIMDLFNGEIVAYSISDKQDTSFVLDTLNQLQLTPGTILHSDQGSVYTSHAYQGEINRKGIIMSMSRKGTPADNAPIESFHSTLKSETFYLEGLTCTTTAIVEQTVRDYIQYYNAIRIQTRLKNQSPIDFRRLAA